MVKDAVMEIFESRKLIRKEQTNIWKADKYTVRIPPQ